MLFRAVLTFFIYTLKSFFAKTLRRIPKHYVFSESKGHGEKKWWLLQFFVLYNRQKQTIYNSLLSNFNFQGKKYT